MSSYNCSFCGSSFNLVESQYSTSRFCFGSAMNLNNVTLSQLMGKSPKEIINLEMYKCPNCGEISVQTSNYGSQYTTKHTLIYPNSKAKHFPEYVPDHIREDYEEAYSIIELSPKAAAALCRRTMESMIDDVFNVNERTLAASISKLEENNLITNEVKTALQTLKDVGNEGAHFNENSKLLQDIEPEDAQILLKFIEYLENQWYTSKHNSELLMASLNGLKKPKSE